MAEFCCAGAWWRVEISDFCLLATALCCLAIAVDEYSDWLQHCLMNIHAKIITGSIARAVKTFIQSRLKVKYKDCRSALGRGSMSK